MRCEISLEVGKSGEVKGCNFFASPGVFFLLLLVLSPASPGVLFRSKKHGSRFLNAIFM
jgi:hypothetical protein